MEIVKNEYGFLLLFKEHIILEHSKETPFISVGYGKGTFKMKRGSFNIKENNIETIQLSQYEIKEKENEINIRFFDNKENYMHIDFIKRNDRLVLSFYDYKHDYNRLWLNFKGYKSEHIYGCGEQYSKFDLKGDKVDIWVSEHVSFSSIFKKGLLRKLKLKHTPKNPKQTKTYYAQPTFISSQKYFCHVEDSRFMSFDFTNNDYNGVEIWGVPKNIFFGANSNFADLLENMTGILGRQPELPEWVYNGVILGIQDGTDTVLDKISKAKNRGIEIGGVWCQDWEGQRITSFGKQLMWDWKWDEKLYPRLDEEIKGLKEENIKFLGYINPFLAADGDMYKEALEKGYLVKNKKGENYLVKSTTFLAGMIDLTNPSAYDWIKNVIKKNMIDFGFSGWMADFGEYLPVDSIVYSGQKGEEIHNLWPVLWAKVNREAIEECNKLGEILIFTRAGYNGSQKYSTLMWTGDQHVDWSKDYGLSSVIPAQLSLAMSGFGISHSDIGGYTTFLGMTRTKELFMRWVDMATFTPVMRTHEGNQPDKNWQFDSDEETLIHFSRMSRVYKKLTPYIKQAVKLNHGKGIPVMRPLFIHYGEDDKTYDIQYQYLLGRDILVAPILKEKETSKDVYLPKDNWVHIWTGKEFKGGEINIEGEIGYPPVFYRKESKHRELFEEIKNLE